MRAIDADAISYESIDSCDTGRHEHYYGTGIIAVRKEDIDAMPTIQPKRGRWISADAIFGRVPFYCSECGENTLDTVMGKPRWNFCPNCGCAMNEDDTNERN